MLQLRNSAGSYGIIAQAFHWVVAGLVFLQIALGFYAADLPVSLARLQWLSRHKSLGMTILVLVLLRMIWRRIDPPPTFPAAMASWERRAALAAHRGIYALLILVMLSGWLHASATGLSVNWFGAVRIPDLIPRDAGHAALFKDLHEGLVATLVLLLIAHIGAAARHAVVLRDGVLRRMLPIGLKE
ncbi:MAG: cytochrome b [Betaproteobacteria bacterium]|nr:cytochrome b [Betaproteobacteria bacterium]